MFLNGAERCTICKINASLADKTSFEIFQTVVDAVKDIIYGWRIQRNQHAKQRRQDEQHHLKKNLPFRKYARTLNSNIIDTYISPDTITVRVCVCVCALERACICACVRRSAFACVPDN